MAVLAFHFFGGDREFNPMAIVIRPFRIGKTFRFWKPFKDLKHGNDKALKEVEQKFVEHLGTLS